MASEENKEKEYDLLKQRLKSLNVAITPIGEFDKKFLHYKENWKSLTK